ncbi:phage tail tape measure protein [Streptomyces pseudogriseolus]|uniref:phage tail tape measure protein n=1 Tax=Streptomyces pseudogriseolus TaxID=36817 RepID=UPI003248D3B4
MATLEELLVAIGINTDDLTAGTAGAADQVESSLGGIQTAAAGAAVGGMFMAGMQSAMDMQAVENRLQSQLGLTEQEAARAGEAAGRVYSAGWGQSMEEVGDALASVSQAMGGVADLTDAEMDDLTKKAMMLGETFEMDVAESANAAGQMIKLGMAGDGKEAFDILTAAAQSLPAAMRADIPAVVSEYGMHFKRLGLDGQTAFGMLSQYVQAGGRDIDQAADVIHEFARITSEETDRAAEAFKTLGLDSGQMLKDIGKGGDDAEQALTTTLKALRGVKDPAKQAALGVALFGDMAGEGNEALWAMDPATAAAAGGMNDVAGAADKAVESAEASKTLDAIWRTMSTTLGEMLLPVLKPVSDFMSKNPGMVKLLAGAILALGAGIGLAVIAQWAWNASLWAWPGTWIIAAIIAVIAIIALIIIKWDEISAATGKAWSWISAKVGQGTAWVSSKVSQFTGWISAKWNSVWSWITGKTRTAVSGIMAAINWLGAIPGRVSGWFGRVISYVGSLPGKIARATSGMWDGITRSFKSAVNSIIGGWNSLTFTIGGGSVMGIDIPSITLHTPNIPFLAEGGVTTGPTFAMIGEGREQEAVLPLSKLDGMLRSVAGAVRRTGGDNPGETVIRVEWVGRGMRDVLRAEVQSGSRGGNVQNYFGTP